MTMEHGEDCSVKVAVHVRPLIGDEKLQGCKDCVAVVPGKPQVPSVLPFLDCEFLFRCWGWMNSEFFGCFWPCLSLPAASVFLVYLYLHDPIQTVD